MTLENNTDKAYKYLVDLGNSSQEIYETLKAKGIKGERGRTVTCPLAIALHKDLNLNVQVGADDITIYNGPIGPLSGCSIMSLPWEAQVFVYNFDDGQYDDLVGDPYGA